jgi:hypothetical protein
MTCQLGPTSGIIEVVDHLVDGHLIIGLLIRVTTRAVYTCAPRGSHGTKVHCRSAATVTGPE